MFRLYVGNLAYSVDPDQLKQIFSAAGNVIDSAVPKNDQGRSKGFGFVEFETEEQMRKAIEMFDGKEEGGRQLRVNEARPREDHGAPAEKPMPQPKPTEEVVDTSADASADASEEAESSDSAAPAEEVAEVEAPATPTEDADDAPDETE